MSNETERPEQVIANLKARLRDSELILGTKDRSVADLTAKLQAAVDRAEEAEAKSRIDMGQCDDMTLHATELATRLFNETSRAEAAEDRVVTLRTCTGNLTSDLLAVTKSRDEFQRLASLRERERDTLQAEVARLKDDYIDDKRKDVDHIIQLRARLAELEAGLRELFATVKGECPSLLNEDSGGDSGLDIRIAALLGGEGK